jgi:hypothetical protein
MINVDWSPCRGILSFSYIQATEASYLILRLMPAMVTLPRSGIIFISGKFKSLLTTIDIGYNTELLRGDTEVRGVKK